MHYLAEGAGEPVVMVHGNPTWSFYFRELIAALRGTHRCIVPDHVGCGLSDKPGDDCYHYTLTNRVADLEALLDHEQVAGATFLMHDWGGMIALAAALRRPERVKRLVILNTAGFLLPPGKRLPWQLKLLRPRNALSEFLVRGMNLFCRSAVRTAAVKGLEPAVAAGLLAPYDSWANRIAVARFVQDIPLGPGDESFELCRWVDENLCILRDRPALVCWGRKDFVFDDDFLAEWRRRLPHADFHAWDDAGHYVLEDARDRVVKLVQDFLHRDAPR